MSFPSKQEREKCWLSRDEFWKCLDDYSADNQVGLQDNCAKFREIYESTCPSQWVIILKLSSYILTVIIIFICHQSHWTYKITSCLESLFEKNKKMFEKQFKNSLASCKENTHVSKLFFSEHFFLELFLEQSRKTKI